MKMPKRKSEENTNQQLISDKAAEKMLKVGRAENERTAEMKQVCFKMDSRLIKRCDAVAKNLFMSRSVFITQVVRRAIERYEETAAQKQNSLC